MDKTFAIAPVVIKRIPKTVLLLCVLMFFTFTSCKKDTQTSGDKASPANEIKSTPGSTTDGSKEGVTATKGISTEGTSTPAPSKPDSPKPQQAERDTAKGQALAPADIAVQPATVQPNQGAVTEDSKAPFKPQKPTKAEPIQITTSGEAQKTDQLYKGPPGFKPDPVSAKKPPFCYFPDVLVKAIFIKDNAVVLNPQKMGQDDIFSGQTHNVNIKDCSNLTDKDVSQITALKLEGINAENIKELTADDGTLFTNLSYLDLSNSPELVAVPAFVAGLPKLKGLNISNTGIKELGTAIANLTQLQVLNVSNTDIHTLGSEIAKLTQLQVLNVSHTGIHTLGSEIAKLTQLKELNISGTKITNLGPDLCELKNLTTLKAGHNTYEGSEMPLAIVCLSKLKNLDLSYSGLQYIDEYVWYLKKLENFNLRGNKLINAPMLFGLMKSLVTLDLRDNRFEYQPVNSLSDCSQLQTGSKEREDCQEELLSKVRCEYHHQLHEDCSHIKIDDPEVDDPEEREELKRKKAFCENNKFKRGKLGNQSFIARYEEMTGEKHVDRQVDSNLFRCYPHWINQYVFYGAPDDPRVAPPLRDIPYIDSALKQLARGFYLEKEEDTAKEILNMPFKDEYDLGDLLIDGVPIIVEETQLAKEELTEEEQDTLDQKREIARKLIEVQAHYKGLYEDQQLHQFLLNLTINGKTIRELRLALDERAKGGYMDLLSSKAWSCHTYIKGVSFEDTKKVLNKDWDSKNMVSNMGQFLWHGVADSWFSVGRFFFFPKDTAYGPSNYEVYPERHSVPNWIESPIKIARSVDGPAEQCNPIDFNTPIPKGPLGPWDKALPAVQSLVEEKFLEPGWNRCENWPTGRCYDWEERAYRGDSRIGAGFFGECYGKEIENRPWWCRGITELDFIKSRLKKEDLQQEIKEQKEIKEEVKNDSAPH